MNNIEEKIFNRSIAFLEVAIISSKENENDLYNTPEYTNVTAYLLYHSTELFLKFALLKLKNKLILGHDIFKLHEQYKKYFNEEKYNIVMPFCKPEDIDYPNYSVSEVKELKKKFNMSFEQQLKYPIDSNNTVYNPVTFFDTEYLESYKQKFLDLHWIMRDRT